MFQFVIAESYFQINKKVLVAVRMYDVDVNLLCCLISVSLLRIQSLT